MHQVEIATTQETLLDSPEMVLNMGPQHPSTHGVLRVVLKLDGETVSISIATSVTCTEAWRRSPRTACTR